jgi:PIN like domain
MRILIDECVPKLLSRELVDRLSGHVLRTAREMGWAGKKNGELLRLMADDGFEILLTVDRNLQYQQNLTAAGIAVVVMVAATNRLADLLPLVPKVEAVLSTVRAGEAIEVELEATDDRDGDEE